MKRKWLKRTLPLLSVIVLSTSFASQEADAMVAKTGKERFYLLSANALSLTKVPLYSDYGLRKSAVVPNQTFVTPAMKDHYRYVALNVKDILIRPKGYVHLEKNGAKRKIADAVMKDTLRWHDSLTSYANTLYFDATHQKDLDKSDYLSYKKMMADEAKAETSLTKIAPKKWRSIGHVNAALSVLRRPLAQHDYLAKGSPTVPFTLDDYTTDKYVGWLTYDEYVLAYADATLSYADKHYGLSKKEQGLLSKVKSLSTASSSYRKILERRESVSVEQYNAFKLKRTELQSELKNHSIVKY